jgi:dTDP-4-amino-4,6-dideoxygalactose transaminase
LHTELSLPAVPAWADTVWHLYVVRAQQRDALQRRLNKAGIGTLIHYPIPPHKQQAYANAGYAGDAYPRASRIADEVLSLPIGPHLSPCEVGRVIDVLAAHD